MDRKNKYWKERCNNVYLYNIEKNQKNLEIMKEIEDKTYLQNSLVFQKLSNIKKYKMKKEPKIKKLSDFK